MLRYIKIASFCLCAFFILSFLPYSFAEDSKSKNPVVAFDNLVYDFGSVKEGTLVERDFRVLNKGGSNLVVKEIVPRCGCTATSTDTNIIQPGEEGIIHISFDTTGFSGHKNKTVRVFTNDPITPSSILTMTGAVVSDFTVEPRWLVFKDAVKGSSVGGRQVLKVQAAQDSKVTVRSYRLYSSVLNTEEIEKTDKTLKLAISIAPDAPVGEFRDRIVVSFSGGKRSSMNIPIFGSVQGSLKLSPSVVSFGSITGKGELKREVQLINSGDRDVDIVSIKSNHPALSVSHEVVKPGREYLIQVTLQSEKIQKSIKSSIDIKTSSEEHELLSLGVKGVLPED